MSDIKVGDRVSFNWEGKSFLNGEEESSWFRGFGTVEKVPNERAVFGYYSVRVDLDTLDAYPAENAEWVEEPIGAFMKEELTLL